MKNKIGRALISIRSDQWLDVLDELNIGAFTVNKDHKITEINYSAQALIGLRRDDVVERGLPRNIHRCALHGVVHHRAGKGRKERGNPIVEVFDEENNRYLITPHGPTPIFDGQQRGHRMPHHTPGPFPHFRT